MLFPEMDIEIHSQLNYSITTLILLASLLIVLMFRTGITGNDIYLRKLAENSSELNNLILVSDCNSL